MSLISVYNKATTNFNNNGLVVLAEAETALITEELNGLYELELTYPIDSRGKWEYLIEGNIIKADEQLFRIYRKKKTSNKLGIVVNARHIFYDLLDNFLEDVRPTDKTASQALNIILSGTQYANSFTATSDIAGTNTAYFIRKNPIEAIMGDEGIIDNWGGELYRNNFLIDLQYRRGADRGVLITYGKNLTGIEEELDIDTVITRIYPVGNEELTLPEKYIDGPNINAYEKPKIRVVEFDADTVEDLRALATEYINSGVDIPNVNYKVNFIELSRTEQYKDFAILERVYLGDTVTIRHSKLGISLKARAIKYRKDALTGRYLEIELGAFRQTTAQTTNTIIKDIASVATSTQNYAQTLVNQATEEINQSLGGYVLKRENELLIMDTADPNTAVKLWRWNSGGLGYSATGYNGPYQTAITADGKIIATMVKTGILAGGLVKFDLDNGTLLIGSSVSDYKLYFDGTNLNVYGNLKAGGAERIEFNAGVLDFFKDNDLTFSIYPWDYPPKVYIGAYVDSTNAIVTASSDWQVGEFMYGKIFATAISVTIPAGAAGYYHSLDNIELPNYTQLGFQNIAGISCETLTHEVKPSVVSPGWQGTELRYISLRIRYLAAVASPVTIKVFVTLIGGR